MIGLENDLKSGKLSMELRRRSKIPFSRSKIKADFFIPSFWRFRRLRVGLDNLTVCLPHISLDGGGWLYYYNLSYTKRWAIYKFGKRSYTLFYINLLVHIMTPILETLFGAARDPSVYPSKYIAHPLQKVRP